jgi:hypothetical protein
LSGLDVRLLSRRKFHIDFRLQTAQVVEVAWIWWGGCAQADDYRIMGSALERVHFLSGDNFKSHA